MTPTLQKLIQELIAANTCQECDGTGKKPVEVRPGVFDMAFHNTPCSCQNTDAGIMEVVSWLNAHYHGTPSAKPLLIRMAIREFAKMCGALGIEPKGKGPIFINPPPPVSSAIHAITYENYRWESPGEWAAECFAYLITLAKQAGIENPIQEAMP